MSDTANAASPAPEETTQALGTVYEEVSCNEGPPVPSRKCLRDIQEHEDSVMKMQVMTKNCGKLTVHVQVSVVSFL
ncbi:hypothetical protein MRX96_028441 [Rhipicephalus microplus]